MVLAKEKLLARAKDQMRTGNDSTGLINQLVEYINSLPEPEPETPKVKSKAMKTEKPRSVPVNEEVILED